MNLTTWITIDPVDTLFFRGSESMEAGENHVVDTMFPPLPSTLIGAVRTAILKQNKLPLPLRNSGETPQEWNDQPLLGTVERPGFELIGPLFLLANLPLFPVPANWFTKLPENEESKKNCLVQTAELLTDHPLGLKSGHQKMIWVKNPATPDLDPLSGYWTTAVGIEQMQKGKSTFQFTTSLDDLTGLTDRAILIPGSTLFVREQRVGLAMTANRTAREGHLFSSVHIRLQGGVQMLIGIHSQHELPLANDGILQLGGEQRICRYQKLMEIQLPQEGKGGQQLLLSPFPLSSLPEYLQHSARASGKLLRIGGWDMQKNFHKPIITWLPSGTIFFTNQSSSLPQCINL